MRNEKGITLIALIITVIVLIIIAGVSIKAGTDSLDDTRLKGFYTQLEIIQKRVDDIATTNESYISEEGNLVYLKNQGSDLSDEQKTKLEGILASEEITNVSIENFRYFTISDLENELDLFEMEYDVFIDFNTRMIVAEKGITIKDTIYYVLENKMYLVEENTTKNVGTIESLIYSTPIKYGENTYKVIVTPSNTIGDIDDTGYVKYKKTITKYWETSNNTEMILEFDVEYNVQYIDLNNNSIEKLIKVEFEKDEEGNLVQDEEGNNVPTVIEITEN